MFWVVYRNTVFRGLFRLHDNTKYRNIVYSFVWTGTWSLMQFDTTSWDTISFAVQQTVISALRRNFGLQTGYQCPTVWNSIDETLLILANITLFGPKGTTQALHILSFYVYFNLLILVPSTQARVWRLRWWVSGRCLGPWVHKRRKKT